MTEGQPRLKFWREYQEQLRTADLSGERNDIMDGIEKARVTMLSGLVGLGIGWCLNRINKVGPDFIKEPSKKGSEGFLILGGLVVGSSVGVEMFCRKAANLIRIEGQRRRREGNK